MLRAAVLFYRFGPYHVARLRAAARVFQLTAIEYCGVDSTYAWEVISGVEGFARLSLFSKDDFHRHPRAKFMGTIAKALEEAQPDVVAIPGWGERCSLAALLWCSENTVPAVIMSDSLEWLIKRRWWKEAIKRQFLHCVSAGLAAGAGHRQYLEHLGVPGHRISLGFDVVDNDYFANESRKVRNDPEQFRGRHQLPSPYFLASSRFVDKKNLEGLLQAHALYRKKSLAAAPPASSPVAGGPWSLVLLGDGPLKPDLCSLISDLSLDQSVHLPGFIQYAELPAYYALAGAFIMPSLSETWGLTVNEAMACGLPVVVSTSCGCADELVQDGVNGFLFDPYNIQRLADLMATLSAPSFPLSAFGSASRDIIANWGTDRFASSLQSAAETAVKAGPRRGTFAARSLLSLFIGT